MRNLLVYPITLAEIIECLDTLSAKISEEESIGDMRPLLLQEASRIVMRAGFAVSGIMDDKRIGAPVRRR